MVEWVEMVEIEENGERIRKEREFREIEYSPNPISPPSSSWKYSFEPPPPRAFTFRFYIRSKSFIPNLPFTSIPSIPSIRPSAKAPCVDVDIDIEFVFRFKIKIKGA